MRASVGKSSFFNCDEGIDFQAMGRIFIGFVRCGAFNRLLEEQMSCHLSIQAAIKTHAKVVSLLGREITVNHNTDIFITMARKVTVGDKGAETTKIMAQRIVALFLAVEAAAFYTATLRVETPFAKTHLVSRRSVAAGPQAQPR